MKEKNTLDTDDAQVGRILSRREVLALLGGSSVALLAACAPGALTSASPTTAAQQTSAAATTAAASSAATVLPSCIVRPALTEGPYFVDEKLDRSDIRSDPATGAVRPGALLTLNFLVSRVSGSACTALSGAVVDVWHCDALGAYSDVDSARGQKFLRGFQTTDASGSAKFTTVYPGWYQGRAVHIHFKIRPTASSEFTSQLFFDDALSTQVFAQTPYSQKGTQGITRNSADSIFQQSGGKLTLNVTKNGDAYAATFDIGLAS
ncbi:MAG: intradiol ring-cleavage dioxygenase [Chloroflexota bacterium]|nr:intradiol ring-cleavage dioxygenase [Chloroflexota bacterium]